MIKTKKFLINIISNLDNYVSQIGIGIIILGWVLLMFQNFFFQSSNIHETSLMPQPWFKYSISKISSDFFNSSRTSHIEYYSINQFFIRSFGSSDLSIIVEFPRRHEKYISNLKSWPFSHDYFFSLYQHHNESLITNLSNNFSQILNYLPTVLCHLKFIENNSSTLIIERSPEVPMDLLKLVYLIFTNQKSRRFQNDVIIKHVFSRTKYPYLVIHSSSLEMIEPLISSLDRMENIFIHGPMLYKAQSNSSILGITYILLLAFLSTSPHLLSLAHLLFSNHFENPSSFLFTVVLATIIRFSSNFLLIILLSSILVIDSLSHLLCFKSSKLYTFAIIPFLLEILGLAIIYPEESLKLSVSSEFLMVLSPLSLPVLVFIYGKPLYPVMISILSQEILLLHPQIVPPILKKFLISIYPNIINSFFN